MITRPVVEANLVRLFGNTRPEANAANDLGRVANNLPMEHLLLQLRRPAARSELRRRPVRIIGRRSP
jgi:hypothetical protein